MDDGRFEELIREQARSAYAAVPPPIERVAADVVRVGGFIHRGRAASGHEVAIDEPAQFGGGGTAADPAELLLVAIGASLSVTLTVHAVLRDMTLTDVAVSLRGTLDAGRFFSPTDQPGGGFADLVLEVELVTPASADAARALLDAALLASPVLRSIDATPTVRLTVRKG